MAVRSALLPQRLPVDPLGILGLLALIALWWAITSLELVSRVFLPPPAAVAQAVADNLFSSPYLAAYNLGNGGIFASLIYTTTNVLIALAIACVVGTVLGLTSARLE